MDKRVLTHYRFGKSFAWINRKLRTRRNAIERIRKLYTNIGLVSDGCSLCRGTNFTLLAQGDRYGFDLNKQFCNQCGLIQTYPSLAGEFHNEFYSHHYRSLYLKSNKVNYQLLVKEQQDKGREYLKYFQIHGLKDTLSKMSVIEIGCSSGGVIETLKPFVSAVHGCDLDIHAIKHANIILRGCVEVAEWPSSLPDGKRLFIMSHVLEHVQNPLRTLEKLRVLMNEGDLLFIAVPGINMVAEGAYKNDLRRYFHIAHVTDFTASTLAALTHLAGFKEIVMDEQINCLLKPAKPTGWTKSESDSIENIRRIENSYNGFFPHL
jgi:2-polyprenyl-3-methyl-5-hydroxy-6-metoxy-1,4-benzoquinol methylase